GARDARAQGRRSGERRRSPRLVRGAARMRDAPLTRPFASLRATLSPHRGARGNGCPSPRARGEGARSADEGRRLARHIAILVLFFATLSASAMPMSDYIASLD